MDATSFDRFDVTLGCRALFLDDLRKLLLSSGTVSEAGARAICEGAGGYFDGILNSRGTGSFKEEANGLTSSHITLVGEDDLELGIRLDELSARLFETTANDLWKIHLRFITLLSRPELPKNDNPVGPKAVARGLDKMFQAAAADTLDQKLALLERIEGLLREGLPPLYARINDYLEHSRVEAAPPMIVSATESRLPNSATFGGVNVPTAHSAPTPGSVLIGRLGGTPTDDRSTPSPGGFAHALLNQATLDALFSRLDDIQYKQTRRGETDFLKATSPDLASLLPGLFTDRTPAAKGMPPLKAAELGIMPGAAEGPVIDAVGLLCEALLADPDLPDPLKQLISGLQIALVKVALRDSALFTSPGHPMQSLLDRLEEAFFGTRPGSEQETLGQRLNELVAPLRSNFSGDEATINDVGEQLDALLAERRSRIASAAAPCLSLFLAVDRRNEAKPAIEALYARAGLAGQSAAIRQFFTGPWQRLLEQAWLAGGEQGADWKRTAGVVEALLWSFRPKADAEERKRLARQLPEILNTLKQGMEQLQLSQNVQSELLDHCFELQTRAMRRAGNAETAAPETARAAQPASGEPVRGRLSEGDCVLHTLDLDDNAATERAADVRIGDWLAVAVDEALSIQATVCEISASGRCLLFDPALPFALAIHPRLLEAQLKDGAARFLDRPGLFERTSRAAVERMGPA